MTLKIPVNVSFTAAANLLGVIGVTGSLVFVGLELRQNQVIAIAGQQQARTVARLISCCRLMILVSKKLASRISHGKIKLSCRNIHVNSARFIIGL